jgi:hypothetical protein
VDVDPGLVAHLRHLEEELLRPGVRRSRAPLEALLAPDFVEVGRSGRVYDREAIVGALAADADDPSGWPVARIESFAVRLLAASVALATYDSVHEGDDGPRTVARRASIWRQGGAGDWRLAYHQGTPVP